MTTFTAWFFVLKTSAVLSSYGIVVGVWCVVFFLLLAGFQPHKCAYVLIFQWCTDLYSNFVREVNECACLLSIICFHIYYCYYCSVFVVFFCFIFPHAPITALKSKRARTTSQTENISPTDRPIDRPIYSQRERRSSHSTLETQCHM